MASASLSHVVNEFSFGPLGDLQNLELVAGQMALASPSDYAGCLINPGRAHVAPPVGRSDDRRSWTVNGVTKDVAQLTLKAKPQLGAIATPRLLSIALVVYDPIRSKEW